MEQPSIAGSVDLLGSVQLLQDREGMDDVSKALLKNKEVLAVILKFTADEFRSYSYGEIMGYIEGASIASPDVSPGRTNSRFRADAQEYKVLNEKTSQFDILFRAVNPALSEDKITVNLHIGIEPQKDYRPGYAIEKRGIFYLSRELTVQLSPVLTDAVDYGSLEKCYSIWICSENVPREECNTISFYMMDNVKNVGNCCPKKEDYDLMQLVIIRLGRAEPDEDCEGCDLIQFLRLLFLPQKDDILQPLSRYIDFSKNEELRKEVDRLDKLGMGYFELGIERGEVLGRESERRAAINRMLRKLSADEIVELGYDREEINRAQEDLICQ